MFHLCFFFVHVKWDHIIVHSPFMLALTHDNFVSFITSFSRQHFFPLLFCLRTIFMYIVHISFWILLLTFVIVILGSDTQICGAAKMYFNYLFSIQYSLIIYKLRLIKQTFFLLFTWLVRSSCAKCVLLVSGAKNDSRKTSFRHEMNFKLVGQHFSLGINRAIVYWCIVYSANKIPFVLRIKCYL